MSAGVTNQISFARESTWGTAVTPNKSVAVAFGDGIQTNNDTQEITGLKAQIAKVIDQHIGKRVHEGPYEMDLYPDHPAFFVASALGGVSSALKGGESIVYQHTITEAESKPSLTIEQAVVDNVRRYAGCIATGFKISAKTGETVKFGFGVKAKSQATATKITAAYPTTTPFIWSQAAFKIGGSQISEVISFEVEYKNNIEFLHALNSAADPGFNFIKGSEVTGKFDCYLNATTANEMADYLNNSSNAIDVTLTGAAIGTSSNYVFDLNIPVVKYTAAKTPLTEDHNLLSVEFKGQYDTSTSRLIRAIITNLAANLN